MSIKFMLTKRQKQTLNYIKSFSEKKGYAPSLEEIKKHLKLSSVSTAHHHVKKLKEYGYLKKEAHHPRGIDTYKDEQMVKIPLLGKISAGNPIQALQSKEYIAVPRIKVPQNGNIFALRVYGDSMIDENISDGDVVLVRRQKTFTDGQQVVALINNGEITLKKIFRDNKRIRLQPANKDIDPIIFKNRNDLEIQGIVIDLIKTNDIALLDEDKKGEERKTVIKSGSINKYKNKVIEGDCLKVMKEFPDNSIDMILCDLPYGTTQNQWDSVIPLDELWEQYERIIKDKGVIALTAQGAFTAQLILSNAKLFKYKIVWVKSKSTNFLNAKKQPLRRHEDILIFYKNQPAYSPQMAKGEPYNKGFRKDQLTGSYGDFKTVEVKSGGERYPTDVVYFKTAESEGKVYHPTQKPAELGRYLIRTFSQSNDIVLDNTCGSGSFLVSAILENRNFIGIEKNQEVYLFKKSKVDYIEICKQRIEEANQKFKAESSRLF